MLRIVLTLLACVVLAAHHLRDQSYGLVLLWLSVPGLLWIKRPWAAVLLGALLGVGTLIWIQTAVDVAVLRQMLGQPWLRAGLILGAVALMTLAAAAMQLGQRARAATGWGQRPVMEPVVAAAICASLLAGALLASPKSAILLERYLPGGGWMQIAWVSVYAAWVTETVLDPRRARTWRPRLWVLFSIVFYLQLVVGLAGVERFLMTGALHVPVPAVIAAGPVFRGGGFFMAILFAASIVVVGPAWCSWLCYLGGWDNLAALRQKRPGELPAWRGKARLAILVVVVLVAFGLGRLGVSGAIAAALAIGFGIFGVGIMATLSRRRGVMVHCTSYCPIGWLATRLGKVNPFRMRIDSTCTECMACTRVCRYDALSPQHIRARAVGEACTLCGDCISACLKTRDIHYSFPGLGPGTARTVFLVLVAAMHATFLGIAMI